MGQTKEGNKGNNGDKGNKKKGNKGNVRRGVLFTAALLGAGTLSIGIANNLLSNLGNKKILIAKTTKETTLVDGDGQERRIYSGSFVLAEGDKDGKSSILSYDENGNIFEGIIDSNFLEVLLETTEKELEQYNIIYQINSPEGASVLDENGDTTDTVIYYNDYVLGQELTSSLVTSSGKTVAVIGTDSEGNLIYGDVLRSDMKLVEVIGDDVQARRVNTPVNLQLKAEPGYNNDTLILGIPPGSKVIIDSWDTEIVDGREWIRVEYTDDQETVHIGWVVREYLSNPDLNKRMVNTSGVNLNLRTQPSLEGNIIKGIPNGSIVDIFSTEVKSDSQGREWRYIKYTDKDQNVYEGWAANTYLEELESHTQSNNVEEINNSIETNAMGEVVGIDVSSISPENLRKVLANGIPSQIENSDKELYNTTGISGEINYVCIKLGGASYGEGQQEILTTGRWKQRAQVCEQLGIPYALYYYSTAINEKEMEKELDDIGEQLNTMERKYNVFPLVIDIEGQPNDRQYTVPPEELSKVKAKLVNGIQERGYSKEVWIYTAASHFERKK